MHLISNATELMAEDCYDIAIRFGKRDTKKRLGNVINNLMNTPLKTKACINETAHYVFLSSGNTHFYKVNWWSKTKAELDLEKEDSLDMNFIKAALSTQGVSYEEIENISNNNKFPKPTASDLKNAELLSSVYQMLNDSIKKMQDTKFNCVLYNDPYFSNVYKYAIEFESDEVVYIRG